MQASVSRDLHRGGRRERLSGLAQSTSVQCDASKPFAQQRVVSSPVRCGSVVPVVDRIPVWECDPTRA